MHLIELYKSVQGESSFAGLPCIFVRLAGCNLRCAWCDSEYTFAGGKPFTQDEIVAQIEALAPCKLVEFTGGEPMLQARELLPLMDRLLDPELHADDRDLAANARWLMFPRPFTRSSTSSVPVQVRQQTASASRISTL